MKKRLSKMLEITGFRLVSKGIGFILVGDGWRTSAPASLRDLYQFMDGYILAMDVVSSWHHIPHPGFSMVGKEYLGRKACDNTLTLDTENDVTRKLKKER